MEGVSQARLSCSNLMVERARKAGLRAEFRPESDYTRVEIVAACRVFMPAQ